MSAIKNSLCVLVISNNFSFGPFLKFTKCHRRILGRPIGCSHGMWPFPPSGWRLGLPGHQDLGVTQGKTIRSPCQDHMHWKGILGVWSFEKGNVAQPAAKLPTRFSPGEMAKGKQKGNVGKTERQPGIPTVKCASKTVLGQWDNILLQQTWIL